MSKAKIKKSIFTKTKFLISEAMSNKIGENSPNFNIPHFTETKLKMSLAKINPSPKGVHFEKKFYLFIHKNSPPGLR